MSSAPPVAADAQSKIGASDIKKSGFGCTNVVGVGREEGGPSSGKSFLVIGCKRKGKGGLKRSLTSLGRKYGQMGIIVKQNGEPNAKFVHIVTGSSP
jgi:hypothetical protein